MIQTLDLNFMGVAGAIASYLIPHSSGVVLVECGPGSTIDGLRAELGRHGYQISDVSDVLLTHIHLDHAGAAGWLAQQGARIHVHPVGAPHLLNPEKLLASAARIYGDQMQTLWGDFFPVPPDKLNVPQDGEEIQIAGLRFLPVNTPGHANHHYSYIFRDTCFSGDIGGIRLFHLDHLRIPMPPPELNLEDWRVSLVRLKNLLHARFFSSIAPTHFGIYQDAALHLKLLTRALDDVCRWIETVMPADPSVESIDAQFRAWTDERAAEFKLDPTQVRAFELANPTWMSASGMQRYWKKFRTTD
jgi:glyoxylase-like metal-dependent hydrolase (beta-lactamase superfamily II)